MKKVLFVLLGLSFFICPTLEGRRRTAIGLIDHVQAGSSGGGSVTTGAINTTGANFIVINISYYSSGGALGPPTDSKGNTYTGLTDQTYSSFGQHNRLFYCANATVGSGHTFTWNQGTSYAIINVGAFSNVKLSSPLDQQNGSANTVSSTIQPGSITPVENNELVVTGVEQDDQAQTPTVSGATLLDSFHYIPANFLGGGLGYTIQTTAAAFDPTWTVGSATTYNASTSASFKLESGAGPTFPFGILNNPVKIGGR